MVRGSKLKILSTKCKGNGKKFNLRIDYIILKCYDATKMRNNTKALRLNTRAKLSWYRRAWRPVLQFSKFGVCPRPKHCWEAFAVCGVIFFSLLFCIYIEVVRSTLLKIPLSLPFGECAPFNESAWFQVAN